MSLSLDAPALNQERDVAPSPPASSPADPVARLMERAEALQGSVPGLGPLLHEARAPGDATVMLAADQDRVGAGARALDPDSVDRATAAIRTALATEGLTETVTHADLDTIKTTLRDLSRADATAVVGRLSGEELALWAGEVLGSQIPILGGYDTGERNALYAVLAGRLDGAQLARVAGAFGTTGDTSEDRRIGQAITAGAPADVRADLVDRIATTPGAGRSSLFVAGEVLSGLPGEAFDRAVRSASDAQLRAVVGTTMEETLLTNPSMYGSGLSTVYNADTLGRLLDRVAAEGDTRVKAIAFEVGASWLATTRDAGSLFNPAIGKRPALEDIRDGLTAVIESDPAGVARALEQDVDRGGQGLTTYVASLLADGQDRRVGQLLGEIVTGNGQQSAPAWFSAQERGDDGRPYLANAQTLGYAVGAVYAATDALGRGARQDADSFKAVFGTMASVAGAVSGPASPVVSAGGAVLTTVTNAAVDAILDEQLASGRAVRDRLVELTFPRTADGSVYNGGAETVFDATVGRVIDARR